MNELNYFFLCWYGELTRQLGKPLRGPWGVPPKYSKYKKSVVLLVAWSNEIEKRDVVIHT